MGLETESDFDKYCKVVRNPQVGRISRSKPEVRAEKEKSSTRNYLLRNLDDNFTEISFGKSRTFSGRSTASGIAGNEALRRDSVYHGSNEVRKVRRNGSVEARQKIELSPSSDNSLSFRIFDSSLLDKNCPLLDQRGSTLLSVSEENSSIFDVSKSYTDVDSLHSQDLSFRFPTTPTSSHPDRPCPNPTPFSDISMDLKERKDYTSCTTESEWREQSKFKCDQTSGPINDGNGLSERDTYLTLHKSSSEKVGMPYSPCRTQSDCCKDSPRSRFSPFRRMFNPIMKSKSLRSSSVSRAELGDSRTIGPENIQRNKTFRKSLLNDFSNTAHKTESGTKFIKKDDNSEVVTSSPAHLHGNLTLELKHGVPYFELLFNDSEDVLSAKTWRANNAYSWVYTFHSMNSGRTSNSNGRGARERHQESSMIGQMQVSCFLLSEMRNSGAFDNSMVTEFVLYDIMHARNDIMHARRNVDAEDKGTCGELKGSSDFVDHKLQTESASVGDDFDCSTHYPWTPADLHPHLEIAAIVIQVPFEKRESLKDKRGNKLGVKDHQNLLDFSAVDIPSSVNRANVKVVIPAGSHGLPNKKTGGAPSPLLERWRSGGSCDCGGWDMACPLLVSETRNDKKTKDNLYLDNQQPVALFFQGEKDKIPALSIKSTAKGKYSVDFHARLSKLQAFSICVSILHGSEASTAIEQEKHIQTLPCNSLKVLLNEEARFLMEAVADKEKRSLIARA